MLKKHTNAQDFFLFKKKISLASLFFNITATTILWQHYENTCTTTKSVHHHYQHHHHHYHH